MEYRDDCVIPAGTGTLYNGKCRYQDVSYDVKLRANADESVTSIGMVFFPNPVRIAPKLTTKITFGPQSTRVVQTGILDSVERVGNQTVGIVHFTDVAEESSLGTIDDLVVGANGSGSVYLTWTPVAGVSSYQAQADGVNSGSSVDYTNTLIVLTGLAAGSIDFTVDATDGATTTTSNTVTFVVT